MTATLSLQIKCDVTAEYRPKVLVVSHERSGTHFVMNSLALNLDYVSSPWINLDLELGINYHSSVAFESLVNRLSGKWIANLLKSHHEFGFYADWLSKFRNEFKVIYMVRDALPVLRSYHRFLQKTDWFEGPKIPDPSEFIRATPVGAMTRFQYQHAESITHRWCNHVQSWIQGGPKLGDGTFLPVYYDDLNEDFEKTMQKIANFLGLPMSRKPVRPDRNDKVVHPSPEPLEPMEGFTLTASDLVFVENATGSTYEMISRLNY